MYKLTTPVTEDEIRQLKIGDILYISGRIFTARDGAHKRAIGLANKGKKLPFDIEGLALWHCGPIVKSLGKEWKVVSAGCTTSSRMEMFEEALLKYFPIRIIIGKGGMGSKTTLAMKKFGAVYGSLTGGCAALAAQKVLKVEDVIWLDLGMPEALWILQVKDLGPMIVSIDSHGNNLHELLMIKVRKRVEMIRKQI
jgi:fumarate hydratase subunit beta